MASLMPTFRLIRSAQIEKRYNILFQDGTPPRRFIRHMLGEDISGKCSVHAQCGRNTCVHKMLGTMS